MNASGGARILAVHPGAELYGSDRMFAESVRGFVEAGHVVVAALPGDGPLRGVLEEAGASVEFAPVPVLRKAALTPRGAAALLREVGAAWAPTSALLRRVRPDLVYVNTVTIPTWLVAGRLSRARVVGHVHEAESGAPRVVQAGLAAPLLLAHECVVNSDFAAGVLTSAVPVLRRRSHVVPNGVAGPPVAPAAPAKRPLPHLVFVGRLSPRKGPDVAVRATRRLRERGVPARLTIVGSVFPGYEWFEAALRSEAADLVDGGVVQFRGFTTDVWGELAAADIALVPSVMAEPFGNAAVEAILAGRPVVASRIGGLPEAVAGAGSAELSEPGSEEALADAVQRLLARWEQMPELTAAAAAAAADRFGPATYRRRIAASVRA